MKLHWLKVGSFFFGSVGTSIFHRSGHHCIYIYSIYIYICIYIYLYIYIYTIFHHILSMGPNLSVDSVESALKALANGNDWPVLAKNPQNWTLEFCGISGKDGVSTRTPTESSFEVDSSVSPLPGSRCVASETGRDVSGAKVLQLLMKTHRGQASVSESAKPVAKWCFEIHSLDFDVFPILRQRRVNVAVVLLGCQTALLVIGRCTVCAGSKLWTPKSKLLCFAIFVLVSPTLHACSYGFHG